MATWLITETTAAKLELQPVLQHVLACNWAKLENPHISSCLPAMVESESPGTKPGRNRILAGV